MLPVRYTRIDELCSESYAELISSLQDGQNSLQTMINKQFLYG
jgi:hypothetical protein